MYPLFHDLCHSVTLFLERNHSFEVFHGSQIFTKPSEYAPPTTRVYQKSKSIADYFALLVCFGSIISKVSPKKLDRSDQN